MKCGLDMSKGVLSVQTLYGAANVFCGKNSERLNSVHLAVLYQNTKTSLYKPSKKHRVCALLEIIGFVRKNLQLTVSLDHPVAEIWISV